MERKASIKEAELIFGENFIGVKQLRSCSLLIGIKVPDFIPDLPYSIDDLKLKSEDYILMLGSTQMTNGKHLSIKSLRNHFGLDPDKSEPCFYNQDWYLNEPFIHKTLENKWYLIRKNIFTESRSINPDSLLKQYKFPSAILCTVTFFLYWFIVGKRLWEFDFIWCEDLDHNGDRIYVGKYRDIDGINKNGFSIHRHLKLRDFYGCVDVYI